jgi:hypothetical protein
MGAMIKRAPVTAKERINRLAKEILSLGALSRTGDPNAKKVTVQNENGEGVLEDRQISQGDADKIRDEKLKDLTAAQALSQGEEQRGGGIQAATAAPVLNYWNNKWAL